MHPLVLVSVFICCFPVNVISSQAVLTNVAYSKPVTLSTEYRDGIYPESNAVNGLLSDYTHTSQEKFPWLRIDLEGMFQIHLIEVFARADDFGYLLHDVDITVGKNIYYMKFCGHFTGNAFKGQRIAMFCPHETVGRYVQLQIVNGDSNYLTPAEVLVWGVREIL